MPNTNTRVMLRAMTPGMYTTESKLKKKFKLKKPDGTVYSSYSLSSKEWISDVGSEWESILWSLPESSNLYWSSLNAWMLWGSGRTSSSMVRPTRPKSTPKFRMRPPPAPPPGSVRWFQFPIPPKWPPSSQLYLKNKTALWLEDTTGNTTQLDWWTPWSWTTING